MLICGFCQMTCISQMSPLCFHLVLKGSLWIIKHVVCRVCQLYSDGNKSTKSPHDGALWFRKHKRRARTLRGMNRKVTFCKRKMRCVAKCSCFGSSPQFHPDNYCILPDNHCVNHNYTEPALPLTMKIPAAPSLSRSLLFRLRALLSTRRDSGQTAPWGRSASHQESARWPCNC